MTSTLEHAAPAEAPRGRTRADVVATRPVAAVTAAFWAAGVGLLLIGVLVSLAWAVSTKGDDGVTAPLAAAGTLWLAAHHAPVTVGGVTVSLLPLLLLALPVLLLHRAGRWAVRITSTESLPDVILVVLTGTATYAVLASLVAQASGIGTATVGAWQALVAAGLVAAIGLSAGALSASGQLRALGARLPAVARLGARGAAASGAALTALVGVVAVVAVLAHWTVVTGLERGLSPAAWDSVGILLLDLAYLPNLLVWALSYVAGPGFALGGGATADPFSTGGALLPGVPLLGAVPTDAPAAAPLLLLLPVLAGVVGALVMRRHGRLDLLDEMVVDLGAAVAVGLGAALLAALSGGSLGAERLAALGPPVLAVGLAVTGLVAAGAWLATLLGHALPRIWVREAAP